MYRLEKRAQCMVCAKQLPELRFEGTERIFSKPTLVYSVPECEISCVSCVKLCNGKKKHAKELPCDKSSYEKQLPFGCCNIQANPNFRIEGCMSTEKSHSSQWSLGPNPKWCVPAQCLCTWSQICCRPACDKLHWSCTRVGSVWVCAESVDRQPLHGGPWQVQGDEK